MNIYTNDFIDSPSDKFFPAYNLRLLKLMPVSGVAQYLSVRNNCNVVAVKAVRRTKC
jgi:hypothetical protein